MTDCEHGCPAWHHRREERRQRVQASADALGKTIVAATVEPHDEDGCESANVLRLTMSDGSEFTVEGGYGAYTGAACDEYVELIWVTHHV